MGRDVKDLEMGRLSWTVDMGGVQALYRQVFIRGRQEVRFKQDMMTEVEIGVIGP